ncbi:MAG: type II toxin-antitoxin system RelE/ParE family toxin [Anaerolineae bacterium]|nr:type II toxin-antitoxin system RelE/ParE family toxin [Anaerolineae bacterium]
MSQYKVYVTPAALGEIKALPGHMRQRVKCAIDDLANNPNPPDSKALDLPDIEYHIWRLRIDRWRIIYAITDTPDDKTIDVLAVRKRPPYDYGDLESLLADL